jgi:2,5-furandicarboxylate decarboxylase 1
MAVTMAEAQPGQAHPTTSPKDLRTYLKQLTDADPDQVMVVDREVDPVFEAGAIVDRMRTDGRYPKYPAVLFTNVRGSRIPLLINVMGSYDRASFAIDATLQTMVEEFGRRESSPIPPRTVSKDEAPVKEVILTGDQIDLGLLPILRHQELDAGKYITSGVVVGRDPNSGIVNAGIYRMQLHGPRELGFQVGVFQNMGYIFKEHKARNQPLQVAVSIGHHPGVLLAATTNPPGMGGELAVAGGLLQQPLEMVRCETVDLEVPARAEIVIEGTVDPNPDTYREEGPFGEYPKYYTGTGKQPVLKVSAITMRRNPIYLDVFNATNEHLVIGGLARMGFLLNRVRDVCPSVTNLHLPLSATARLHAYISMKKQSDGEPHLAAFNLLSYNPATKHVFIVDDDIDVTNEADVLWALGTRFQADKDLVIIKNSAGVRLNPPTYAYERDKRGSMETKLIFDCTRPMGEFPPATRVPPDVKARMDPGDYVRAATAGDLQALLGL